MNIPPRWDEKTIAKLTDLCLNHPEMDCTEIGERLGGFTKNAIIGKRHRLNLPLLAPARTGTCGSRPRRRLKAVVAPPPAPKVPLPAPRTAPEKKPPPRLVSITSRPGHACYWPLGDPGEPGFHFCGRTSLSGKPYCEEHTSLARFKRSA